MSTATTIKKSKSNLPKTNALPRPWWKIVGESIFLIVLAIAFLEVFFRFCGVGQEELLEPDLNMGVRHIANKLVIWRLEGYSHDKINSKGLRDTEHSYDKAPGTLRVALLGDSATESVQVPLAETYGKRLETLLNARGTKQHFEVMNFGCSSFSTGQEYLTFKNEVVKYHPDIVMLLYARGDHLENVRNVFESSLKLDPRPYFYLDNNGQLQQDNGVLQDQKSSLQPNKVLGFLRHNSAIYGVLSNTNLALSINESLYRKLRSWFLTPFRSNASKLAQKIHAPNYPLQDNWKVTSEIIKQLNDECVKNNCRFYFLVFPNSVYDPVYVTQMTAVLKQSQEQNFVFYDLTTPFRQQSDLKSLFLKYHFSSKGHELVANKLASLILDCK